MISFHALSTTVWSKFNYWSWKGKAGLADARAALERVGPVQDPDWVVWAWVHQEGFERNYAGALERLDAFPNDWIRTKIGAFPKILVVAQFHELMGEGQRSRRDYESARVLLEREVEAHPEDPRYHSSLGVVYAALGRRADAVESSRGACP